MEVSEKSNKRIAKNTLMLYIRMLLSMLVSLYTSRVVLEVLGVQDFGIYNVVAGFVTMLGFINNAMTSATQRFLSFEIGKKDFNGVRKVFSMSVNIHWIIAVLIIILAETLGLWFIKNELLIPSERISSAIWVYHLSILTLVLNVVSVPYSSLIIAYEKMEAFAVISLIEVFLKLGAIILLKYFGYDKLILYGFLIFVVSLVIRLLYSIYCRIKIKNIKYFFYWNYSLFQEVFKYVGWMVFGTTAQALSDQGLNMLMNIFFGVTVNAARAIAFQVRNAVQSFVVNFMIAIRPQIIKLFAQGNHEAMNKLVFTASKMSFFLLFLISLPVLLLTENVLGWWLKIVPDFASLFTRLVIIDLFFTVLFTSITTVSQASGKIRLYQIVVSLGFILNFFISYVFFKLGYPSFYAFIIIIIVSFLSLFMRLIVLKKQVHFPMGMFIKKVFLKALFLVIISLPLPLFILFNSTNGSFMQLVLVTSASSLSIITSIWFIGMNSDEKQYLLSFIRNFYNKIRQN